MSPPEGANSIEWPIEMTRASEAAARAFWPLGNTKLEKRLRLIEAPTLVLWGEATPCCRRAMRRGSPAGINGATRVQTIPAPDISPISTSRRRSPGPCWTISPDAFMVARTGRSGIVRRVAVSRGLET